MNSEEEILRFSLTPLQSATLAAANKVNETTNKYIQVLNEKILELSNQLVQLRKESSLLELEISEINKASQEAEAAARVQQDEVLKLVISEFKTPAPPWKAHIVIEKGAPVGIELIKAKPQSKTP